MSRMLGSPGCRFFGVVATAVSGGYVTSKSKYNSAGVRLSTSLGRQ